MDKSKSVTVTLLNYVQSVSKQIEHLQNKIDNALMDELIDLEGSRGPV